MCSQIPGLKEECEPHIYEAALTMHNAEMSYITKIFEMGDIENLTAYDLHHFIKKRVGDKIAELGYTNRKYKQWDWTEKSYDQKAVDKMAWFDHLTGGHTHTDFFAVRPTDYSKANEGEDFEDIW
tara:strand:- start:843 stop:1217 length:375 start_codon:yes stop_codon:yes gene_type:complete